MYFGPSRSSVRVYSTCLRNAIAQVVPYSPVLALLLGSTACDGRQTTTHTVTTRTVTAQPTAPRAGPAASSSQLVRVDSSAKTETSTTPAGGALEMMKAVFEFLAAVAWPLVVLVGVFAAAKHLPKLAPVFVARLRGDDLTLQVGSFKLSLKQRDVQLAPLDIRPAEPGGIVTGTVFEL